jgi:hypothetical protein
MKKSQKQAVAVGAGVATLAAAAAAAYYLTGKGGAKNRKKVAGWVAKAKNEVVKEVKNMGITTEGAYNKAVDAVMKNYKNLNNLDKSEILALATELKSHWKSIQSHMGKLTKKPAPANRRPALKAGAQVKAKTPAKK